MTGSNSRHQPAVVAAVSAGAQAKEIRVLLANHPYGEILTESQLTTKLTTEFATGSSSVDVFMTRPLQEGKMFYKNGWYAPLAGYDFSDLPRNAMSVATFGSKTYLVPLVTEWEVLYHTSSSPGAGRSRKRRRTWMPRCSS